MRDQEPHPPLAARPASGAGSSAALGPISVVVVNFNGAEHLPHALDALFAQSLPIDEILLVDNASTDGSARAACEKHPSVRLIELEQNDGPCPARNAGLAAARNAWVLLLDNDAVLQPETLARLVHAASMHPEAAVLQPRSVFASEPSRVHYDGGEP
ncbi:MAG TPA: glycosyltransferase, partial [Planctomycetota bacterium]|nr:glycosyltransferase [Planctomycetota bacterium]